jgi:PAS domain S-box-containing protein
MSLDIRTLYMVMGVTCFIVAGAFLFFESRQFRTGGVWEWSAGYAFQGSYWIFIGLRGLIPDFLSIIVANTFLTANYSLLYAAVREFQHRSYRRDILFLPIIVTFIFISFFSAYIDNFFLRTVFVSLLSAVQMSAIALILFREGPFHLYRSQWLTGCFFAAGATLWSIRLVERFIYQTQFWGPSVVLTALLILGFGVVVLTSFGFMLMIRERAGEALRESEEKHRLLIEHAPTAIYEIDFIENRFKTVNDGACSMLGYTEAELLAMSPMEIIDKGYREIFLDRIRKAQAGETPAKYIEYKGVRKDGSEMWGILYNRFKYTEGKIVGAFVVAHDITERKKAEQALAERTAKLEEINKELESFSYSISHDLRAPLRAIDGYARMILKKEGDRFDEDTTRKFNDIRANAQMMGKLIDDILTLSRLGRAKMSIVNLEMEGIIKDVWKELQTINPERNMALTIQAMPSGYGDRTLIKQVYANLLGNAVKFTKYKNPAEIEVGGYAKGNENVYYVKDNGIGFDMEYYDKLFGIFQRLHTNPDFEGTGVGLATIQRAVHRHGGHVWAEGKVDEGATFYFSLPSLHARWTGTQS